MLLGLTALWSGTFPGAARWPGAVATQAGVLAFALLGAAAWRDPWRLGRGRWLLAACWLAAALSWALSPVERAGRVGLVLGPAFVLLPAAVARCWRHPAARRLGTAALAMVCATVALVALVSWQRLGSPRAAMPLGHHNLLAGWLVAVVPLALLPWRSPRLGRVPAAAAGLLAAGALAATASLLGLLAAACQCLLAARWWRRARPWLLAGGALLLVATAPRLARLAAVTDLSARARTVYWQAGWRGLAERPLLGWGPGSTPWTIGDHLRPVPGVNPPSEVVGDLHSLPVQLGYELGAVGLLSLAALAALLLIRWRRPSEPIQDPGLRRAALVSLAGSAVWTLGNAPLAVPALPIAWALALGALLAAHRPLTERLAQAVGSGPAGTGVELPRQATSPPPPRKRPAGSWPRTSYPALLYVAAAGTLLVPLDLAHRQYDRAAQASSETQGLESIAAAVATDPAFPLYRARAAWLQARLGDDRAGATRLALEAAEAAPGIGALWLQAGVLAAAAGDQRAAPALRQAIRLDPLSPLPPLHLALLHPDEPEAPDLATRALTIEPRLAAAVAWEHRQELWMAVAGRLGLAAEPPAPGDGPVAALGLSLDHRPALSFSLYAFRRRPWATDLAAVPLRRDRLPRQKR